MINQINLKVITRDYLKVVKKINLSILSYDKGHKIK